MLVLSRKEDESIIVNDNVRIQILSIKGNTVRIGVEAPQDVPVHREEVQRRVENEIQVVESEV